MEIYMVAVALRVEVLLRVGYLVCRLHICCWC